MTYDLTHLSVECLHSVYIDQLPGFVVLILRELEDGYNIVLRCPLIRYTF